MLPPVLTKRTMMLEGVPSDVLRADGLSKVLAGRHAGRGGLLSLIYLIKLGAQLKDLHRLSDLFN